MLHRPSTCTRSSTAAGPSGSWTGSSSSPRMRGPPAIPLRTVIDVLDPAKDIDGIHPLNAGLLALGYEGFLPATAHAAVEILKRSGIPIEGRRGLITGEMLRPGAVVGDIGINVREGRIVGDVDMASAAAVVSAIAPVPGGVGPLTNAILPVSYTHLTLP